MFAWSIELSDVEAPTDVEYGKILFALFGRNDVTNVVLERYSRKDNKFNAQISEFTDLGKKLIKKKERKLLI